jgi:hypothetical protein
MHTVGDFDTHASIPYYPTRKPYWGRFPYRVSILIDTKTASQYRKLGPHWLAHKRKQLLGGVAGAESADKMTWLAGGVAFFFDDAEVAKTFIDANVTIIEDVHRPVGGQEAVMADPKVRVQKNLYWLQFRYKISFNVKTYLRDDSRVAELDEWALTEFPFDDTDGRGLYSVSDIRTLYLRDERDILLTQLMVGHHVKDIEKVILFSELGSDNEI